MFIKFIRLGQGIIWLLSTLVASRSYAQADSPALANAEAVFQSAQASGKSVLLVFSGSDWCAPCIRLEREVLSDSAFLRNADEYIILLKADFPQRKKQELALQVSYEQLAQTYNREGEFPKVVLISPDRKRVSPLSSVRQTPATLMAQLHRMLIRP